MCLVLLVAGCRSAETSLTGPTGSKCTIALSYTGGVLPASGGSAAVGVTTGRECTWTVSNSATWVTVGSASGQGSSSVPFTYAGNTSTGQRQASLTIGGQAITLTQAGATCVYTLIPLSDSIGAATAAVSFSVATQPGCAWTATSTVPWITVTSGGAGSGNGQVTVTAAANEGAARTGTVAVASQTFTLAQAGAGSTTCVYTLSPASRSFEAAGGAGSSTVTASAGCAWTATSSVPWITVTGGSGNGSGTLTYTVAANSGAERVGTIGIPGQTLVVTQASGAPNCNYSVSGGARAFDPAGGSSAASVAAPAGCEWTTSSSAPWLRVTSGASGSGNGTVSYVVEATTGGARSATLTVAGQPIAISQSGCTYAIAPASQSVPNGGGPGSIAVTAPAGCAWTASASDPWISISSGGSGSGTGTVSFTVAANSGPARSGTIAIATERFTVNQAAGTVSCSYVVAPLSATFGASGGTAGVDVSTAAGCTWTATSGVPWATITAGATGSGSGRVEYSVQANAATAARTGSLTVAGQAVSLSQAGAACSYAINPSSQTFTAAGGTGSTAVTAQSGCAWVATSGAAWISITSGQTGSGNGTVGFTVAANNTGSARIGQITIQNQTFTVTQQ